MANGSPTPTYNPSSRQISTTALEARDTMSMGGWSATGTPPTPMPMLACTGTGETATVALMKVTARATFHGEVRPVWVLTTGPKRVTPALAASLAWLWG